jgi:hypothetical protein
MTAAFSVSLFSIVVHFMPAAEQDKRIGILTAEDGEFHGVLFSVRFPSGYLRDFSTKTYSPG